MKDELCFINKRDIKDKLTYLRARGYIIYTVLPGPWDFYMVIYELAGERKD